MPGAPVEVKIKGIRQLDAGAARLFSNIEQATDRDAVEVTAQQAAATIRARVPKRTGALASTVRVIDSAPAAHHGPGAQVVMGGALPYAKWIEFGRYRGRAPRGGRYVYPTAKRTTNAFRKHCQTACAGEIRRMRWHSPS